LLLRISFDRTALLYLRNRANKTPHKQQITIKNNSSSPIVTSKPPLDAETMVGGSVGESVGETDGRGALIATVGSKVGEELGVTDGWFVGIIMLGENVGLELGITVSMLGMLVGEKLGAFEG